MSVRSVFIGGIIILVLIALGYFYLSKEKPIRNYPSKGTDIIAFGDSLVEGVGASAGNDFISLLSRKIGRPVINLGKSGDTTAEALRRIGDLDDYHPQVVLLLLGGNDHLRKVPIAETFKNLSVLIEDIQGRGAIVVLLGVRGNLFGDKFEPEFEKLQNNYQTAYIPDVLSGLFGHREYMADPIHPNDAGYAVIANRVYPVLVKLLQ